MFRSKEEKIERIVERIENNIGVLRDARNQPFPETAREAYSLYKQTDKIIADTVRQYGRLERMLPGGLDNQSTDFQERIQQDMSENFPWSVQLYEHYVALR